MRRRHPYRFMDSVRLSASLYWIPAFAGKTAKSNGVWIPAYQGKDGKKQKRLDSRYQGYDDLD